MELLDKVRILSAAAKYDASCASSGSKRQGTGLGTTVTSGICHSWSDDGRCISLLKILFSNSCIYDCAYCVNRSSNDIPRATFTPEELVDITINFYRRNYIEGLFLSSSVFQSPNHTMETLLRTVRSLRQDYNFYGYIHLKAIPGADYSLIKEAGHYVDRMSVNIELPSSNGLARLAPQKKKEAILEPMRHIGQDITEIQQEQKRSKTRPPAFVPAGQSTQLIVGATDDNDLTIVRLSQSLYKTFNLRRVYYSAYLPVSEDRRVPQGKPPELLREHRLYQADWLLRFYGFTADELLSSSDPQLSLDYDPKVGWALRNMHVFPVEINRADYHQLLRVPGLGNKSAQKILQARRVGVISYQDLRKIGVVLKRARYFITCQGKYYGDVDIDSLAIRRRLVEVPAIPERTWEQLSLFPAMDRTSRLTGEL